MDPLLLIGLGILLLLSAFFSGSETALTSLGKIKIKNLIKKHPSKAKALTSWLENPSRLLTTILVGNNVVNIAAATLATVIILRLFRQLTLAKAAGISTLVMALLVLIVGEVTPKTYARQHAERLTLKSIGSLILLSTLLSPLIRALTFISKAITNLLGLRMVKQSPLITEDEIKTLISVGEEEGVLEEEEKEMIHSIFEFGDTEVGKIMVPKDYIVFTESKAALDEMIKLSVEVGFSRIPVCEDGIDKVIGIFYVKDLLKLWGEEGKGELSDFIREPYFVQEKALVSELLRQFQHRRIHMAIVQNGEKRTVGLITMEDVIEEIVGEIEDEYDEQRKENSKGHHLGKAKK